MLESHLDSKVIKLVNPNRNQPWIFPGRTDAEAEAPILWPPDGKSWLTGKDPDAGKDKGKRRRRAAKNEVVRQHHWLNGHEFKQTPADSKEQGESGMLQSTGLQTARHDLATEQQQVSVWAFTKML